MGSSERAAPGVNQRKAGAASPSACQDPPRCLASRSTTWRLMARRDDLGQIAAMVCQGSIAIPTGRHAFRQAILQDYKLCPKAGSGLVLGVPTEMRGGPVHGGLQTPVTPTYLGHGPRKVTLGFTPGVDEIFEIAGCHPVGWDTNCLEIKVVRSDCILISIFKIGWRWFLIHRSLLGPRSRPRSRFCFFGVLCAWL